MRQQHQHKINTQTTKEAFIQNEQVMMSHPEPIRTQQAPDIPVIHSKSSPAIPHMSDSEPNKMENIKNLREMPGIGSHIDSTNINPIHRSTSKYFSNSNSIYNMLRENNSIYIHESFFRLFTNVVNFYTQSFNL